MSLIYVVLLLAVLLVIVSVRAIRWYFGLLALLRYLQTKYSDPIDAAELRRMTSRMIADVLRIFHKH